MVSLERLAPEPHRKTPANNARGDDRFFVVLDSSVIGVSGKKFPGFLKSLLQCHQDLFCPQFGILKEKSQPVQSRRVRFWPVSGPFWVPVGVRVRVRVRTRVRDWVRSTPVPSSHSEVLPSAQYPPPTKTTLYIVLT